MQDQTQYLGTEGVVGPLPLTAMMAALELLEVPRDAWLELVHRLRILHAAWSTFQREERKRNKGRPKVKESEPREMMKIPYAKRLERHSGK